MKHFPGQNQSLENTLFWKDADFVDGEFDGEFYDSYRRLRMNSKTDVLATASGYSATRHCRTL